MYGEPGVLVSTFLTTQKRKRGSEEDLYRARDVLPVHNPPSS